MTDSDHPTGDANSAAPRGAGTESTDGAPGGPTMGGASASGAPGGPTTGGASAGTAPTADEVPGADEPQLPASAAHRRAPRYGRFILTGILLAGIIAFVITLATGTWSELTPGNLYLVLMLYLVPAGVLAGALTALILDRRSLRRADSQLGASGANPR